MSTADERARMKKWEHGQLVADLAGWLDTDGFVAGECRFGRAWGSNSPIPDVLKIRKSYTRWDVQIFEVKASRADFLGELRNGKWQDYLPMSSRLYFASPVYGVVNDVAEIPAVCGWIVRGPTGWKVIKIPKIRQFTPDADQLLALLMNYDDRLRQVRVQLAADKKKKHSHNVVANAKMSARVYKMESYFRDGWRIRQSLQEAKAIFEAATGIKLPGQYAWLESLKNKLQSVEAGVDVQALRRIHRDLTRTVDYVNALLPEENN